MTVNRVTRFVFFALLCMVIVGSLASGADATASSPEPATKAYSPFDEPHPKIPQEIIEDKRLDQKVTVFCKSKNMKQLFADISAKTGVKITAKRELWGERPIIYFHNRPLRDVMTEISGLYGYRWLMSGKPGSYEYEIFEDIRHSKLREQRKKEQKERQDALLLDFLDKIADGKLDAATSRRLQDENPDTEWTLSDPASREHAQALRSLGTDLLHKALAEGRVTCPFQDLPADLQKRLYEREKSQVDGVNQQDAAAHTEDPSIEYPLLNLPSPSSMADMMDGEIYLQRDGGGEGGFPTLRFGISYMGAGTDCNWPDYSISEKDYRQLVGWDVPGEVAGDAGVSSDPPITKKELSCLTYPESLRVGDVLQAIAEQSKRDVIADYRFQDVMGGLGAIVKRPLNEVTRLLCNKHNFSCQADQQTILFRSNDWFLNVPPTEPPADLLARCWAHIEKEGGLELDDTVDLAHLPEVQRKWLGLEFMPGAVSAARDNREAIEIWALMSDAQIETAASENGLPVADLPDAQQRSLVEWAQALRFDRIDPEVLQGAVIHTRTRTGTIGGGNGKRDQVLSIEIKSGDKSLYWSSLFPPLHLDEESLKNLTSQRKADAAADVVEVLEVANSPAK